MAEEIPQEIIDKALEAVEIARSSGKLKKGANEATKAIEKANAKLVLYAKDVTPPEIVMHLPLLCKEKGIPCVGVATKDDLGAAAGLTVGTSSVAVVKEGEAKKIISEISKSLNA